MLYMDGQTGLSANGRTFYVYWDDVLMFDVLSGALVASIRSPFPPPLAISTTARAWSSARERKVLVIGEDGTARAACTAGEANLRGGDRCRRHGSRLHRRRRARRMIDATSHDHHPRRDGVRGARA